MKKGISSVIATILMLVITIALAGTAYLYISGILTTQSQGIEVVDTFSDSKSSVTVVIRNMGTEPITSIACTQTAPSSDTSCSPGFTNVDIQPGGSQTFSGIDTCTGSESRICQYRLTPNAGRTVTSLVTSTEPMTAVTTSQTSSTTSTSQTTSSTTTSTSTSTSSTSSTTTTTTTIPECKCSWFVCNQYCGDNSGNICLFDSNCLETTTTTTQTPTTSTSSTTATSSSTTTTPPSCILNSVSISPQCSGGSSSNCESGETIRVDASYSGGCPSTSYIQIDASSADGSCQIYDQDRSNCPTNPSVITGITVQCTSSPCSTIYTIPSLPTNCLGKTMTSTAASLKSNYPCSGGTGYSSATPSGSFTFYSPSTTTTTFSTSTTSSSTTSSTTTATTSTTSTTSTTTITTSSTTTSSATTSSSTTTSSVTSTTTTTTIPSIYVSSSYHGTVIQHTSYDYEPSAMYDNSLYKIWWNGHSPGGSTSYGDHVWYANSTNGYTWSSPIVVLRPSPNSADQLHVGAPSVLKVGNTYFMYYTGDQGLNGNSYYNSIFLATSLDGVTWNKYPNNTNPIPILSTAYDSRATGIPSSSVIYYNQTFYMYYWNSSYGLTVPGDWTFLSTSNDGIHFSTGRPVFGYQIPARAAEVKYIQSLGVFLMIYGGWTEGVPVYWSISSDGIHWEHNATNIVQTSKPCSFGPAILGLPDGTANAQTIVYYGAGLEDASGSCWNTPQVQTWDIDATNITLLKQ